MTEAGSNARPCASCGKEASGNFCQHCGASLGGRFCNKCGAPLTDGAKFCNQCGAPRAATGMVAAAGSGPGAASGRQVRVGTTDGPGTGGAGRAPGARGGGSRGAAGRRKGASASDAPASVASGPLPWIVAGLSMFGLILVIGLNMIGPGDPPPPGGTAAPAATGAAPDISNMTPREAADRLFDRVMRTMAAGDTAGALAFQPMAVQAHVRAEPLNLDGVFHMAMLEILTDPPAALASAERILEVEPNHILALGLKGQAHAQLGDTAAATAAFQQLLDNYDTEALRDLEEYTGHLQIVSAYRTDAETFLRGG